uniref:Uncharacterized protein n=1 Tax=Anguilla anguilla TaxID=7936 RepID=A0A0E9SVU0_ANGAN
MHRCTRLSISSTETKYFAPLSPPSSPHH